MLSWVPNARHVFDEITTGIRFIADLPKFIGRRVTLEDARALLRQRLEQRQANLLAVAREAIYARTESPYRRLLDLAGCTYPDLESLVNREGVEGALRVLYRYGVYLIVDESKGRCPVVRGSARFHI